MPTSTPEPNTDLDLRKWCLTAALNRGLNVSDANEMYEFLSAGSAKVEAEPVDLKLDKVSGLPIRNRRHLTKTQAAYLKIIIGMHKNRKRVSGLTLSNETKLTPASCSVMLRTLVKKGYVTRKARSEFVPVFNEKGEQLDFNVESTVYPAAPARGYEPMKAKLGHIARVK